MRIMDVKAARRLYLIDKFLASAGESLKTFSYYSGRDLSATDKHLVTLLGFDETYLDIEDIHGAVAVVYGHLDRDGDTLWLGICVTEGHTGKGYGDAMMRALLQRADDAGVDEVTLAVHLHNAKAITFYIKHGFTRTSSNAIPGRPELLRMVRRRVNMADTAGSLVDKLATINNKLFISQDVLYEIRRMSFESFKEHYIDNAEGARKLWDILKRTCDLNFQRSQIITEFDERIAQMIKSAVDGRNLDDGVNVQRQHKTY